MSKFSISDGNPCTFFGISSVQFSTNVESFVEQNISIPPPFLSSIRHSVMCKRKIQRQLSKDTLLCLILGEGGISRGWIFF